MVEMEKTVRSQMGIDGVEMADRDGTDGDLDIEKRQSYGIMVECYI